VKGLHASRIAQMLKQGSTIVCPSQGAICVRVEETLVPLCEASLDSMTFSFDSVASFVLDIVLPVHLLHFELVS
jgi:hypothetical protein